MVWPYSTELQGLIFVEDVQKCALSNEAGALAREAYGLYVSTTMCRERR
jgi:hypothetical protein